MRRSWKPGIAFASVAALVALLMVSGNKSTHAQGTVEAPYDGSYTSFDLGSVPGVPASYGGLTFLAGDPNTILIGGEANDATGALYSIGVIRDGSDHITGFTGSAAPFTDAAYNDGGVVYGPGDVLFLARWPENELGQTKPGSSTTDKIVGMTALGVTESLSALNFIPTGFPGAGQLKLAVYDDGNWYTAAYAADGSGTYNVTSATLELSLGDVGPEGFTFVPPGSPVFPANSILLAEYTSDVVATYRLDSNGDPIPGSRDVFVSDLTGAEGAVIDPVTGDFLFSTFGGGDHVLAVRGFAEPGASPTPSPTASVTPSPTPSSTPTVTPSGTASATPSGTATATPSGTATATPSGTPEQELTQGDVDCNGSVTSVDALKELRYVALLSVSQTQPCPIIGTDVASFWGDVDCSGSVSSVDALKILRYVALLTVTQTEPCPDIGMPES